MEARLVPVDNDIAANITATEPVDELTHMTTIQIKRKLKAFIVEKRKDSVDI